MFPAAKIAKKFLMHEPFKVDGFEYQFISVDRLGDWAIVGVVYVVLSIEVQLIVVLMFVYVLV